MESRIWLTSDWHFGHNRAFIYEPRGFKSIWEHDEAIIKRHNQVVNCNDIVYCLGDCMLGQDISYGLSCIRRLNGKIYIIRGNHDTDNRWAAYNALYNALPLGWAEVIKHDYGRSYLSHYPTETSTLENAGSVKRNLINFHGHTHSTSIFAKDKPYQYNVGLDAHNCYPVRLDIAYEHIRKEKAACLSYL